MPHHRFRLARLLAAIMILPAFPAMSQGAEPAAAPGRPHDPWVFRCVLDEQPRMIVIALGEGLWLAYDGTSCGLAKAMAGPINFDGAVHTGGHGPQPTSKPPYHEQHAPGATGWALTDDRGINHTPQLLGYLMDDQQAVTLRYGLCINRDDAKANIIIEESPEIESSQPLVWCSEFRITGLPQGWTITQCLDDPGQAQRILKIDDAESPIEETRLDVSGLPHYRILTRYQG